MCVDDGGTFAMFLKQAVHLEVYQHRKKPHQQYKMLIQNSERKHYIKCTIEKG